MRMLVKLLGALVVLVLLLAAGAFLLPREVSVARSITVAVPPATLFPQVNSLQNLNTWSPWAAKDPAMKVTYEGPAEGVGAKMSWTSEVAEVGSGTQEIIESTQDERVVSSLVFGNMPPSKAYFDLEADGTGTTITWTLAVDMGMNPVGRWMGLMMDKWVGVDFDKGLAKLKAKAEGA